MIFTQSRYNLSNYGFLANAAYSFLCCSYPLFVHIFLEVNHHIVQIGDYLKFVGQKCVENFKNIQIIYFCSILKSTILLIYVTYWLLLRPCRQFQCIELCHKVIKFCGGCRCSGTKSISRCGRSLCLHTRCKILSMSLIIHIKFNQKRCWKINIKMW